MYLVLGRPAYNNVDAAHLLSNHDRPRSQSCATDSRDGEELAKTLDKARPANDVALDFDLGVDVVQIASGLEGMVAEDEKTLHGLLITSLLDIPVTC